MNEKYKPSLSLPDEQSLDAFIDAAASLNGLRIEPAYREGVRTHLNAVTNAARSVLAFETGDEAEPAPVFRP